MAMNNYAKNLCLLMTFIIPSIGKAIPGNFDDIGSKERKRASCVLKKAEMDLGHYKYSSILLFEATSNAIPGILSKVELNLDENGDIAEFIVSNNSPDKFCITATSEEFLETGEIVVYEDDFPVLGKTQVIKIKSDEYSPVYGGKLKIDYLSNGLFGKRKSEKFLLEKNSQKWQLTFDDDLINHLCFKRRKVAGNTVGIKSIEINKVCE